MREVTGFKVSARKRFWSAISPAKPFPDRLQRSSYIVCNNRYSALAEQADVSNVCESHPSLSTRLQSGLLVVDGGWSDGVVTSSSVASSTNGSGVPVEVSAEDSGPLDAEVSANRSRRTSSNDDGTPMESLVT